MGTQKMTTSTTKNHIKKNGRYVNNIYDLYKHINDHRRRVRIMGLSNNGSLGNIRFPLRWIIFYFHDIEKYLFLPWLWKYYAGKGNVEEARKLFDKMNSVGESFINKLIRLSSLFYSFTAKDIKKAKRLERIIDVVDRHCDPVTLEEFHLNKRRPIRQFLSSRDLYHAKLMEKKWIVFNKHGLFK